MNNNNYGENGYVQKPKIINNSANPYVKNSNSMSYNTHNPNNTNNTKTPKSKKFKHILLIVLIIFFASVFISYLQQNKTSNTKTYLNVSECKNIAKNYVEDDFLSLNDIKKKMGTSKCAVKDSNAAIDYLSSTYDFNNVAVRKLRLLVQDDNKLTKENAKTKLENFEFNNQEIEFALNHYSDTICSLKKHDLSCEIVKDSVFSKTSKEDKLKDSKESSESKSKSSSNEDSSSKNQVNTDKTGSKKDPANKPSVNGSNSEANQSTVGNAEQSQEDKQNTKTPVQNIPPTQTTQTQQQQLPLVHPGSFCSTSGSQGVTIRGTLMMCKQGVNDVRLRWRKVQ